MNYQLCITFANPSLLTVPNFERIFTRLTLSEIVRDANEFLAQTKTRLLSHSKGITIGLEHVKEAVLLDGLFRIAICSETNRGPLQIMEFKKTFDAELGEALNSIAPYPTNFSVDTVKPQPKSEAKNKYQDSLESELKKYIYFEDIPLLAQQIELAQKEFGRNLRYAAIDKLQDIRDRYSSTQDFSLSVEVMLDEMVGALMNLKS